jgi:hypothetical protein
MEIKSTGAAAWICPRFASRIMTAMIIEIFMGSSKGRISGCSGRAISGFGTFS